jgi:hypothetical protein
MTRTSLSKAVLQHAEGIFTQATVALLAGGKLTSTELAERALAAAEEFEAVKKTRESGT